MIKQQRHFFQRLVLEVRPFLSPRVIVPVQHLPPAARFPWQGGPAEGFKVHWACAEYSCTCCYTADRMELLFALKLKVNQEVYQWAACSFEVRQTSEISAQRLDPRSADYSDAAVKTYSSHHVKPKLNQLRTSSHMSVIGFSEFSSF